MAWKGGGRRWTQKHVYCGMGYCILRGVGMVAVTSLPSEIRCKINDQICMNSPDQQYQTLYVQQYLCYSSCYSSTNPYPLAPFTA